MIIKGNMIRHLDEQHFFKKPTCIYCGDEILRIDEHKKRCKKFISQNRPQQNNINYQQSNKNEIDGQKLYWSLIINNNSAIDNVL